MREVAVPRYVSGEVRIFFGFFVLPARDFPLSGWLLSVRKPWARFIPLAFAGLTFLSLAIREAALPP